MKKEVREMCNLSDMLVEEEHIKIAKEMLRIGMSEEQIIQVTKLNKEQLDSLRRELLQKA